MASPPNECFSHYVNTATLLYLAWDAFELFCRQRDTRLSKVASILFSGWWFLQLIPQNRGKHLQYVGIGTFVFRAWETIKLLLHGRFNLCIVPILLTSWEAYATFLFIRSA